jgi:uncharacterized protein
MSETPRGRFVWHELMSTDPKNAQTFYQKVVGWTTAPFGDDGSYTLWMNGQAPVGGVMELPQELKAMNVPSNWLTYIGTPNVDATAEEVKKRGGTVQRDPQDIPGVGRFAVVSDPQGAVFALYSSESPAPPASATPAVGEFSWHELATTDPKGSFDFYAAVFGWEKTGDFDMGPMGVYQMYGFGGVPMGGIYRKPDEVPVSNWLPYAKVTNADEAAATAKASGGQILQGPIEVPGGDRVAIGMDPQGAVFAVHSAKP